MLSDKEEVMILYVVHGNTFYDGYGYMEHVFGIYTDKGKAEAVKKLSLNSFMRKRNIINGQR